MAMTSETIDHNTFARLVEAGAVRGASIIGQKGGWGLVIQYGMTERALAAKRGAVRIFKKLETLVGYLKGMGIAKFQVDATLYDPEIIKVERSRSDSAVRMRQAHEAAAHDQWFRAQVELAISEADDPNTQWVSNEEAAASWSEKRAALTAQLEGNAS
jgi:hypothetical protein